MKRNIHLVGSMGLEDTPTVFRSLAKHLGERAKRYPDGETGKRYYWIRWQQGIFEQHDQFERVEQAERYRPGATLPYFRVVEGLKPQEVSIDTLGYADAAIASYAVFTDLKTQGVIPTATRFQVSLPTPVAVITSFILREQQGWIEPVYERTMLRELSRITGAIPHDQLAIQWDVCHEVLAQDGALKLHYDEVLDKTLERLERLGASVPEGAELGYHLCYGDPGHKHIQEPTDTDTAVAFANGIAARSTRQVNWIHLPVPRERDDAAYFAPLRALALRPETELILGLVHYTDGVEGTRRRIATAEDIVSDFAIATECGFGRRPAETISELLRIHAQVADG
ncbi:MAG: hypothetical protein ETSY1_24830 [Candidatus Entotheonella factor]|uniref:Cobalamin-independent methionine synthase MetE C-terminal/archaeal domain-containing protein n=1 Tax=Entotheonella factor TaxID=1429438 RepID=W4LFM1_ENTF1|nr:MAG: hypothetical protein ETSY1_24830 [Candidatus Entotheonella factor]